MRRNAGILFLCLIWVSGCANYLTGGPLIKEGVPTGYLVVENDGGRPLNAVLLVPCSASFYGLNRLPKGLSIPQGRSFKFEVSEGCWAVIAGDTANGGDARKDLNVAAGGTTRFRVTGN